MSKYNEKGLTMDNWHKCPNSLVDKLMGTVLSPAATCVVLTVWRLTEGVRERHQAAIPTEVFMRVTKTNRKNTAYQYVNEAVESGLISVQKERGKVSVYSINKKCPLWYSAEVVAEIVPTLHKKEVVAEIATSSEKRHIVVAESEPSLDESSGGKRHTYKDIKIKDNIKDNIKDKKKAPKQKTERELLVMELFKKWNELSGQNIRPLEKRLSHINARLDDGFTSDQIIEAMTFVATDHWHIKEGFNTIELVIRSTDQLEKKLLKAQSLVNKKAHDRTTDKLAVNQNWAGANKSNMVESNTTLEEMMGSW